MIDRLIAGAGAVTDGADRFVRGVVRSIAGGAGPRAPSLGFAVILFALAVTLALVGLELDDDATTITIEAGAVPATPDLGDRRHATVHGAIAGAYVEFYFDADLDDTKDPDEPASSWYYYLVDPETAVGLTVVTDRPPSEVFEYVVQGRVVEDDGYVEADLEGFAEEADWLGVSLARDRYLDATAEVDGARTHDLADTYPTAGAEVTIRGLRSLDYLTNCSIDADRDGVCSSDEIDEYDLFVYDPEGTRALTVLTDVSPRFVLDQSFTGMLRHDKGTVSDAVTTEWARPADLEITVSESYVLDELATPVSGRPAMILASVLAAVGAVIVLGRVGGYIRFRRDPSPAWSGVAADLAAGERIPARVTGTLRTAEGMVHVRDAPADLVRFARTASETTLIVERRDLAEGVELGAGTVNGVTKGVVTTGRRWYPGVGLTADTGPLVLAFETEAERDRAGAVLLADQSAAAPGEPPSAAPSMEESE